MIVSMGAANHLVGISNYDTDKPAVAHLPRVGDYQNIDWERIAALRPDILIVFMSGERMPAGLTVRAEKLKVRLVNVSMDTLDQLYGTLAKLGELLKEPEKAAAAAEKLRAELAAVQARAAGKPRPRVLLAREASGAGTVGRETFLNDALEAAGGANVIDRGDRKSVV